jgi:hypothetical protein
MLQHRIIYIYIYIYIYCEMFRRNAVFARQGEVKHVSMDKLDSTAVVRTVGRAAVGWILWHGNRQ